MLAQRTQLNACSGLRAAVNAPKTVVAKRGRRNLQVG